MKNLIAIVFLFFSVNLFSQEQGAIRGTVLDQEMNNEPLLFAHLQLNGTDTKEQSNLFGNFEMNDIDPGAYVLEISQAGYETKKITIEVKANEVTQIQESLGAITFDFDEVVTEEDINTAKLSSNQIVSVGNKE